MSLMVSTEHLFALQTLMMITRSLKNRRIRSFWTEFWKILSRSRALRVVVKDYRDIFFICQEWNVVKTALQDHSVAADCMK